MDRDAEYLKIVLDPLRVCAGYRPRFGKGREGGLSLDDFHTLYGGDAFYSWFGLDSPLMYAAHRAAGGMTSIYRQIGIGCQWLLNRILRDCLGLGEEQANWSYTVRGKGRTKRTLSLDARIPLEAVKGEREAAVRTWLARAAAELELRERVVSALQGAVFEVRQGYKSKDSKRQNADIANASNAYAHQYLPVALLLSMQIDDDVAERYRRARWLLLEGRPTGTDLDSSYVFFREVIGYDLASFFARNSGELRKETETILERLLHES
jgi:hypothetical protein